MAYMVNRDAPYGGLSSLMALKGRMGDTELVHMSKPEVKGLASLGKVTINPHTGLPEAFNLKDILPIIGGIGGSILLPGVGTALGMGGITSGAFGGALGTGLGSLLAGQGGDRALFNAALSFGTGALLGNLTAGADPTGGGKALTQTPDVVSPHEFSGQAIPQQGGYVANQDIVQTPKWLGRQLGEPSINYSAGSTLDPSQAFEASRGAVGSMPYEEQVLSRLEKPSTYMPAVGALAGGLGTSQEDFTPTQTASTGAGPIINRQKLTGGEQLKDFPDEFSALDIALGMKPTTKYLGDYKYSPAKKGGLVALLEDGGDIGTGGNDADPGSLGDGGFDAGSFDAATEAANVSNEAMNDSTAFDNAIATAGNFETSKDSGGFLENMVSRAVNNPGRTVANTLAGFGLSALGPVGMALSLANTFSGAFGGPTIGGSLMGALNTAGSPSSQSTTTENESAGERVIGLNDGGQPVFEGQVTGHGDGQSDHIPFDIEEEGHPEMAMLSRDEYVLPADIVAMLGNGSSNAGSEKLDKFVKKVRTKSFGTHKQQKAIKGDGGLTSLIRYNV